MAFVSGTSGRVTLGGTNWNVTSWDANDEREELETTNSESSGFYECITDIQKLSGTMTIQVDNANLPYGSYGLSDGSSVAGTLYIGTSSGPSYSFSTGKVTGIQTQSQLRTVVTATVSFTATGSFTRPS